MSAFPERLRQLRKDRGLTQSDFGKIFNLSKQTISGYEKGDSNPPIETAQRFADYFGITIDDLVGRNEVILATEQNKPKDLEKFLDNQEIMFDGVPLTEDDKAKIRKSLEIIFWDAREKNKKARAAAKARREKEANEQGTI
ncbi:MAG: helix-turn-helix domain protein [Firmicutes bacterium]|nr:helix-turn-helix domain protein [Bacillota bacterium]